MRNTPQPTTGIWRVEVKIDSSEMYEEKTRLVRGEPDLHVHIVFSDTQCTYYHVNADFINKDSG